MRHPTRLAAAAAALLPLLLAPPALALPDGPIGPYLDHQEQVLVLGVPALGTFTDGFGPRWGRLHAGIDIGILRDLAVTAAAAGTVSAAGPLAGYAGYGTVVVLDHGEGRETVYAHLSRVDVAVGTRVAAGERLGLAGCTGSCTGTHLHFELRLGGTAVDPAPYLR
jgi:murein DD-endopeptidase MepM/ murein hydrolase activator NlpD